MSASFFVPADSPTVPPTGAPEDVQAGGPGANAGDDDDGDEQTLLQILIEHLSLSFLYRSKSWEGSSAVSPPIGTSDAQEERDWVRRLFSVCLRTKTLNMTIGQDRLICGYLILLIQWMWDDSGSVKEFLDNGGLATVRVSPPSPILRRSSPTFASSSQAHHILIPSVS